MFKKALILVLALTMLMNVAALAINDNPKGVTVIEVPEGDTMDTNKGIIVTNNGTVDHNVQENKAADDEGIITTNNGAVNTNDGIITGNAGIVTTNNGTITANEDTVTTNNGTITTNEDTVTTNEEDGIISTNKGSIEENYGTITTNKGEITTNEEGATITTNDTNGSISENFGTITDTNKGSIEGNYGEIGTNEGAIDLNLGGITTNKGTIGENDGTIGENSGTIKSNFGEVANDGGTIENNDGYVSYVSGTIVNNFGTVEDTNGTMPSLAVENNYGIVIKDIEDETNYWVSVLYESFEGSHTLENAQEGEDWVIDKSDNFDFTDGYRIGQTIKILGETFKQSGCKQVGWLDSNGNEVSFGTEYVLSEDNMYSLVFSAIFEEVTEKKTESEYKTYEIVKDADNAEQFVWDSNAAEKQPLEFVIKAPIEKFSDIKVGAPDKKVKELDILDEQYYTVEEDADGNTVVRLSVEYLQTVTEAQRIVFRFDDGAAYGEFEVK